MAGIRSASEPFAMLLARRVRIHLGATWGLSETGASGPTGNRYGDAPGHACIAVSGPVETAETIETGSADREANMWEFARRALELLESCLRKLEGPAPALVRHNDVVVLKGSCHCRAVRFSVQSETPYPYLWCYCSICRKTDGRRRLRDQHDGPGGHAQGRGTAPPRRVPRQALAAREDPLGRQALLLQALRERALGIGPSLEAVGLSVCFGNRHEAPGRERATTHLPRLETVLGRGAQGPARQALRAVSKRSDHRLAPQAAPRALSKITVRR